MNYTLIRFIVCGLFFISALITDIKQRKIKNYQVIIFLILGLIINISTLNFKTVLMGILTMLIPLVLLPLFAVRMIGAGDIKALCTAGMIMGFDYGVEIMAYSFICAGIIAVILMLVRKNGVKRFKKFFSYISISFLSKKFTRYEISDDVNKYFLFSYGLVSGWAVVFLKYLLCTFYF